MARWVNNPNVDKN